MISIVKDLKESTALPKEWQGFKPGAWTESIDVRDFIQHNYTPYSGNEEFLSGPSQRTLRLWDELKVLLKREIDNGGVLDADEEVVSSITSHKPGYIDKELEVVVGLQTDAPLKRALMPFGGLRMAQQALESYGFKMCEKTADIFKKIRKTHNEGVFDAYTSDIRAARSAGIITGLPDAYGRGRIIGDYRRVALYGTDRLIAERRAGRSRHHRQPPQGNIHIHILQIMLTGAADADAPILAMTHGERILLIWNHSKRSACHESGFPAASSQVQPITSSSAQMEGRACISSGSR